MTLRQVIVVLIVFTAAGACEITRIHLTSDGSNGDFFRTDQKTYAEHEPVTLVLHNTSDAPVSYNLCWSMLERQANGRWEPVQRDRFCTAVLFSLEPGDTTSFEDDLSDVDEPGRYRFRTTIEEFSSEGRRDFVTPAFRIE